VCFRSSRQLDLLPAGVARNGASDAAFHHGVSLFVSRCRTTTRFFEDKLICSLKLRDTRMSTGPGDSGRTDGAGRLPATRCRIRCPYGSGRWRDAKSFAARARLGSFDGRPSSDGEPRASASD